MFGLVLTAAALGMSNFAAAIGIGLSGTDSRLRVKVAVIFGVFETLMPIFGLLLGRRVAEFIGASASYVGGGLLILVGAYAIFQATRGWTSEHPVSYKAGKLVVTGVALSADNFVVGFGLGAFKVSIVLAAIVIAVVSIGMSLVGLEIGSRLGVSVAKWSGELGGVVLILVGAAIASGAL